MVLQIDIPEDIRARVEAIARRSNLTPAQIVVDALRNGHSLEWQEHFLEKVAQGISAAEAGEFASEMELEAAVNRYRAS